MLHSEYKRNIRVVIVVVLKEADTKEVLKEDMGMIPVKVMAAGEGDLPLI
jgi:hypothetical protein